MPSERTCGRIHGKGVDIIREGTGQTEAQMLEWSGSAQMYAEQLKWLRVVEASHGGIRRETGLEAKSDWSDLRGTGVLQQLRTLRCRDCKSIQNLRSRYGTVREGRACKRSIKKIPEGYKLQETWCDIRLPTIFCSKSRSEIVVMISI